MSSRRSLPLILGLEFYAILCGISVLYSLPQNGGRFIYPLDDTYISMAISKNLAQYGVMGLTRHAFSFSSSCPLWIWLIAAADAVTRSAWWVPLALGLAGGIAAIWMVHRILQSAGRGGSSAILGVLTFVLLLPSPRWR